MQSGATFSACRKWRYLLWRIWDASLPLLCFIGMNPSSADENENDATITRMLVRAMQGGYGGLLVVNGFALVETYSDKLQGYIADGLDIIGPENDAAIVSAAQRSAMVLCGWGKPGRLLERDRIVLKLLRDCGVTPYALAINKDGTPKHPLYVGYKVQPEPIEQS